MLNKTSTARNSPSKGIPATAASTKATTTTKTTTTTTTTTKTPSSTLTKPSGSTSPTPTRIAPSIKSTTSSARNSPIRPSPTTNTTNTTSATKPVTKTSSSKSTLTTPTPLKSNSTNVSSLIKQKSTSTTPLKSNSKSSSVVSKPTATSAVTKPKTPLPKFQHSEEDELNRVVYKLPGEVILIILDFYGGLFDQSCGSNVRKFIQLYFGKFTRCGQEESPKFLFRRLELDGTKMFHRSELLRMTQCLAANGVKIAMKSPYVKLLHDNSITDGQQAYNQAKKTLKVLPVQNITSLNVRQLPTIILAACLDAMSPYLEDLTIFQTYSSDTCDMTKFSKLKFPKLRIFRWRGPSAGKDEDLTEFSANTPSLTTLDVQTNTTSIFRFSKALKNWPNLRTVKSILKGENGGSVHGYVTLYDNLPENIQREFFENLSTCSKLSTISLDHEAILPGMLKYLSGLSIKTAEITSCGIGDSFSELLNIASLKKLKLGTYEAVHEVSTDCLCDLVELNIFRTPIFSAEKLSKLKNLKTLTLLDQGINDKFIEEISKELPNLETIDLSDNPISNTSIASIARNCPKVSSVRVNNTGVSFLTLSKEIKYLVVK